MVPCIARIIRPRTHGLPYAQVNVVRNPSGNIACHLRVFIAFALGDTHTRKVGGDSQGVSAQMEFSECDWSH